MRCSLRSWSSMCMHITKQGNFLVCGYWGFWQHGNHVHKHITIKTLIIAGLVNHLSVDVCNTVQCCDVSPIYREHPERSQRHSGLFPIFLKTPQINFMPESVASNNLHNKRPQYVFWTDILAASKMWSNQRGMDGGTAGDIGVFDRVFVWRERQF